MSGKQSSQIFQRRHFNADKFIESGTAFLEPPTDAVAEQVKPDIDFPATVRRVAPVGDIVREKPRKIPMTYKHREQNYERLKWLSQRLDVSMGDLIDEALEAKFSEWRSLVPQRPDPEF